MLKNSINCFNCFIILNYNLNLQQLIIIILKNILFYSTNHIKIIINYFNDHISIIIYYYINS